MKTEGEPKVQEVVSLSEQVLPKTAPQGQSEVQREVDALRTDWEAFTAALTKVCHYLHTIMPVVP